MDRMELGLRNLLEESQKRTEATALLVQRLDALEHNTEQVRRVVDTIAEKQPHLVNDFIERHITDHLFKEFFNIQSALARYSANGNPNTYLSRCFQSWMRRWMGPSQRLSPQG
jgi:hypothetical protein